MIDKRIVYTNESGGVSIIVPAPEMFDPKSRTRELLPELKDASDQAILDFIIKKEGKAKDYLVVESSELPSREFRNGWVLQARQLTFDMQKCRTIWIEKMRAAREPKLAALDVEYQRADESNDAARKKTIALQKQILRDITSDARIAQAQTPEQLKAIWPEVLK